jgi:uracil-DNA glycosylase family 4
MGFFASGAQTDKASKGGMPSTEFLHKLECRACPLNDANVHSPKMKPLGHPRAEIYILGEAPGREDDEKNDFGQGPQGDFLRDHLPDWVLNEARWNNVIRTRPPKNRNPEPIEIECCRPSIVRDIEATRPKVIFGFGEVPLEWATGRSGITQWRGRRLPVKIGNHVCWYYAFWHPDYILKSKSDRDSRAWSQEVMFRVDLKNACEQVKRGLPTPTYHTREDALAGTSWVTGKQSGDLDKVLDYIAWARLQKYTGYDYETSALRPYRDSARLLTAAIAAGERSMAWPVDHPKSGWSAKEVRIIEDALIAYWMDPEVIKAVHNAAFECEWTGVKFGKKNTRPPNRTLHDTAIQAFIINPYKGGGKPGAFALDHLVKQHFGLDLKALSPLNKKNMINEPLEDTLRYNAMDSKYHLGLFFKQWDVLIELNQLREYQAMVRRVPTLVLTQMKGVKIDFDENERLTKKHQAELDKVIIEIDGLAEGRDFKRITNKKFNPGSNDDIVVMLRDVLKSNAGARRGTDKYGTDEEVLEKVDHPIGKMIGTHREHSKLISTYLDPFSRNSDCVYPGGVLHYVLNSIFAETGRTSAEDPNLQNQPKRDHKEFRKQVVARPGFVLVPVDYGQIQARIIAMFSKDKNFVKALWERYDIHQEWAERVAMAYPARIGGKQNLTDKTIMKAFRGDIKNQWTFPAFFGAQPGGIAAYLHLPENIVNDLFKEFWKQFEGVKSWQDRSIEFYKKNGYVELLSGRRRYGPLSINQIFNSPVQGDEADLVISAMDQLSEMPYDHIQPLLEVHDDLTFELPIDKVDTYLPIIIEEMLAVAKRFPYVNVPISVEVSQGPNWYEQKEIGTFWSDKWFN